MNSEIIARLESSFAADAKNDQFEELKRLLREREEGLVKDVLKAGFEKFQQDRDTLLRPAPKKGEK